MRMKKGLTVAILVLLLVATISFEVALEFFKSYYWTGSLKMGFVRATMALLWIMFLAFLGLPLGASKKR